MLPKKPPWVEDEKRGKVEKRILGEKGRIFGQTGKTMQENDRF